LAVALVGSACSNADRSTSIASNGPTSTVGSAPPASVAGVTAPAETVAASASTSLVPSSDGSTNGQTPSDCGQQEWDKVVCAALADVNAFWARTYPEVFKQPYTPISGGFYPYASTTQPPPCGNPPPQYQQIANNAFYCRQGDLIAWDDEGLIPTLYKEFGPLVVAVVFAHEWGHAIQARAGVFNSPTIVLENQADCFAGAWTADAERGGSATFKVGPALLDTALAGFLTFADAPGTTARNAHAHGSGFDRVNGFQDGYDHGASECASYQQKPPTFTELPFLNAADASSGGTLPYADLENAVISDQENYWSQQYPALFAKQWTAVSKKIPYDPNSSDLPTCGGEHFPTDAYSKVIFYCHADDSIAWDEAQFMPNVYQRIGDFAVGTLFANAYAQAAVERASITTSGTDEQTLVDCLTGGWARAVFDRTVSGAGAGGQLLLSPGDLDEGIVALLAFGDRPPTSLLGTSRATTAFERMDHFRKGFDSGAKSCVPKS
jgi:predicted metalloprotease